MRPVSGNIQHFAGRVLSHLSHKLRILIGCLSDIQVVIYIGDTEIRISRDRTVIIGIHTAYIGRNAVILRSAGTGGQDLLRMLGNIPGGEIGGDIIKNNARPCRHNAQVLCPDCNGKQEKNEAAHSNKRCKKAARKNSIINLQIYTHK